MKFFDGLYNFEIVLLVLGVLLFLAALGKLIRGGPSAGLAAFFLIPVGMIGYPSVQSIDYQNGVLSIKKKVHELESEPENETLRASLQQDLGKVEDRPIKKSATTVTLAQAHFALGDEAAAKAKLGIVLQRNPESPDAKELNKKIELSDRLKALTTRIEASPNDTAAKAQLNETVSQVMKSRVANPTTLKTARRAQAILSRPPPPVHPEPHVDPTPRDRLNIDRTRPVPSAPP